MRYVAVRALALLAVCQACCAAVSVGGRVSAAFIGLAEHWPATMKAGAGIAPFIDVRFAKVFGIAAEPGISISIGKTRVDPWGDPYDREFGATALLFSIQAKPYAFLGRGNGRFGAGVGLGALRWKERRSADGTARKYDIFATAPVIEPFVFAEMKRSKNVRIGWELGFRIGKAGKITYNNAERASEPSFSGVTASFHVAGTPR